MVQLSRCHFAVVEAEFANAMQTKIAAVLRFKRIHHILVLFDFLFNIADLRGDVLKRVLEVGILHLQLWFDGQRFRFSAL